MRAVIHIKGFSFLASLGALAACTIPQKPPPAGPVALHVARPPAEVAQVAAQLLAADGFELTTSDASGGIVIARRTKAKTGNGDYLTCMMPPGSLGASSMETALSVTVVAKGGAAGSDVQITTAARTSYPGLAGTALNSAPNDEDCASNGAIEKKIADALK